MKKPFLAVHDYGMGGIWMYIESPDSATIARLYPELKIFEAAPSFLSDDDLARIRAELYYDIDSPPTGYLADLIAARGPDT